MFMIYETAVVLRADAVEANNKKFLETIKETVKEFKGEILVEDAWGVKNFAQISSGSPTRGNFFYFMYKTENGAINQELERRFRINEDLLKFMIIKMGPDKNQKDYVTSYKNPNQSAAQDAREMDKDKKMFSKRKSCYFSAKKTAPDWKDPSSYSWLVNEFGKISPARISGLRPKFQRLANAAIKRGRNIGLISYVSNNTAR
jgi:small subunit ribosomal protein S6